jgi:anti-anti-sigma regulatory factor
MEQRAAADRGELVIHVSGVLDATAARALHAHLSGAREGDSVVLDLHEVREIQNFGLAILAEELASARVPVRLRGVCTQHLRMLRYFGLAADAVAPPVRAPAEAGDALHA